MSAVLWTPNPSDATDLRMLSTPLHLVCFVKAQAGETARAVVEALSDGQVATGLDRGGEDVDLAELVGDIVSRLVRKRRTA